MQDCMGAMNQVVKAIRLFADALLSDDVNKGDEINFDESLLIKHVNGTLPIGGAIDGIETLEK